MTLSLAEALNGHKGKNPKRENQRIEKMRGPAGEETSIPSFPKGMTFPSGFSRLLTGARTLLAKSDKRELCSAQTAWHIEHNRKNHAIEA